LKQGDRFRIPEAQSPLFFIPFDKSSQKGYHIFISFKTNYFTHKKPKEYFTVRRPRKGPHEHPPLPPRDKMKPGMLIMDLSRLIHDLMREQEHMLGIKSGYRMILFHLNRRVEGVSQSRKTNAEDQRETLVCLTEAGHRLDQKLHEGIETVDQNISSALTEQEQQLLIELLLKMRGHICGEN
jgi:hypothetical protein